MSEVKGLEEGGVGGGVGVEAEAVRGGVQSNRNHNAEDDQYQTEDHLRGG